jgi:hypothetical protein
MMTAQSLQSVEKLSEYYEAVLALTVHGRALISDLRFADSVREQYRKARFARLEQVVDGEPLTALATILGRALEPVAEMVQIRHEQRPDGTLSDGLRFRRVDTACVHHAASRKKLQRLLEALGFASFSEALGRRLSPLIRHIVGAVSYRRSYLYIYAESDYISPHDDSHVGERIDVQFPVTVAGVGGVRVLNDGFFEMHYDCPGSINILGPAMWHEVPPLLRSDTGVEPRRYNLGLRFTPDA